MLSYQIQRVGRGKYFLYDHLGNKTTATRQEAMFLLMYPYMNRGESQIRDIQNELVEVFYFLETNPVYNNYLQKNNNVH